MKTNKRKQRSPLWRERMLRGICQSELSRLTGIPQCSISLMERRGIKRADKLIQLAQALHCSPKDLLD